MKTTAFFIIVAGALQAFANGSVLCESSNHSLQHSFSRSVQARTSDQFVLIDWNAHKLEDPQYIRDLQQLGQNADLITMQEGMHSEGFENQFLAMPFAASFYKSFCNKDKEATGVMNMSRYPLEDNRTLVAPDTEPILHTPKVSGYASIVVPEIGRIHIINTHALNFNLGKQFKNHINSVAKFVATLQGPVIWVGDFNTWNGDRLDHLMDKTAELGLAHLNPSNDNRGLKLDHVFYRGLQPVSIEVLNGYKSSDHLPLKAVFKKQQSQMQLSSEVSPEVSSELTSD